jgi:predicted adenine nucleotide alpha hydrolase (AANH) superfamily ATPase
MEDKRKILLHSCCGPCSTAVIEKLAEEFQITLFFYNPNITDEEEYEKRKAAQMEYLKAYNESTRAEDTVGFLEGPYDREAFYNAIEGLESQKEGGERCEKCFELRMSKTARMADTMGFELFGTTLSVSPHKNYKKILEIGIKLEDIVKFHNGDYKKDAGYQRSVQISKEHGLYRQRYCGCEFSKY